MNQERVLIDEMPKFVQAMADKIRSRTSTKGEFTDWKHPTSFYESYRKEDLELSEYIDIPNEDAFKDNYNYDEIMKEAIDVANLAFMIWWSAKYQQSLKDSKHQVQRM